VSDVSVRILARMSVSVSWNADLKLEFHDADTDTDILERILADTSDTRDFLKLHQCQTERHAMMSARKSVSVSVSASWNASVSESSHISRVSRILDVIMTPAC